MVVLNEDSVVEELTRVVSEEEKIELHALRNKYFCVWNQAVLKLDDLVPKNTKCINPICYVIKEGMFKISAL